MKVRAHLRPAFHGESGYVLLILILAVALLAIAAIAIAPTIAFQMKRDREEELIHRGVQYARAIKHYVKKFGRYPTKIEDLEKTNEVRFLRRRYKDPITGKDFKILYMGDVQLMSGGVIGGATPGNPLVPAGAQGPGGAGGQASLAAGGLNANALAGGLAAAGMGQGVGGLNPNPGGAGLNPNSGGTGTAGNAGSNETAGEDSEETGGEDENSAGPNAAPGQKSAGAATSSGPLGQASGTGNNQQVFGGGPMLGVASTSKEKTIRIFNKKDRYYQWQFIYDPSTDRGGLLTMPSTGAPPLTSTPPPTGGAPAAGTNGAPPGQQPPPGNPSGPGGMQPPQIPPDQDEQ